MPSREKSMDGPWFFGNAEVPSLDGIANGESPVTIDVDMPYRDGLRILSDRIGAGISDLRRMVADRVPGDLVKFGKRHRRAVFNPDSPLAFDILFTDVLMAGYHEASHIGVGRRLLVGGLVRAVVAGMCDRLDPSGRSGDFPPVSWLDTELAEKVRRVQSEVLSAISSGDWKMKMKSLRVVLARVSTPVLIVLHGRRDDIRRRARDSGTYAVFDDLGRLRRKIYEESMAGPIGRRRRMNRKKNLAFCILSRSADGRYSKFVIREKARFQDVEESTRGYRMFSFCQTRLRRLLDGGRICFYRRPTDPDWEEGRAHERRRPMLPTKKGVLGRYGIGNIPGITRGVTADEWSSLRANWTMDEARAAYRELDAGPIDQDDRKQGKNGPRIDRKAEDVKSTTEDVGDDSDEDNGPSR